MARGRCSPRCRGTSGSGSPASARCWGTSTPVPESRCCSWGASWARAASGTTTAAWTGISSTRGPRRPGPLRRRISARVSGSPGALARGLGLRRIHLGRRRRPGPVDLLLYPPRRGPATFWAAQPHAGPAPRLPLRRARPGVGPRAPLQRRSQVRRRRLREGDGGTGRGGRLAEPVRFVSLGLPPLGVVLLSGRDG